MFWHMDPRYAPRWLPVSEPLSVTRVEQQLSERTGDPVRAVSVFCRTCPFAVARADDGMAERHARNNPGHEVNKIVTVSFTTRLTASVSSTVE